MSENLINTQSNMSQPMWIEQVREGMKVVDHQGKEIGKVDYIKMGDPDSATTAGNEVERVGGVFGELAATVEGDEPDVPQPQRNNLLRKGYIKVSTGLFKSDRYVAADEIAGVRGETVVLGLAKDSTIKEDADL